MTLHVPVYPQGSRVRVRRGRFPMQADRVGRTGIVVEVDEYRPGRYGVVLDGEEEVLDFTTEELEAADGGAASQGGSGSAEARPAPPPS